MSKEGAGAVFLSSSFYSSELLKATEAHTPAIVSPLPSSCWLPRSTDDVLIQVLVPGVLIRRVPGAKPSGQLPVALLCVLTTRLGQRGGRRRRKRKRMRAGKTKTFPSPASPDTAPTTVPASGIPPNTLFIRSILTFPLISSFRG